MLSPLPCFLSALTKTGGTLQTKSNLARCQTAAEYSTAAYSQCAPGLFVLRGPRQTEELVSHSGSRKDDNAGGRV